MKVENRTIKSAGVIIRTKLVCLMDLRPVMCMPDTLYFCDDYGNNDYDEGNETLHRAAE